MKSVEAVIFDLDGVITDTAAYHYEAWKELGESIGIAIDEEFNEQLKGVSRMESLERLLRHGNRQDDFTEQEKEKLATRKNEQYKRLIKRVTPDDILPGIKQLLVDIRQDGIKIGMASASKNAFEVVGSLKIAEYFDYIVDSSTVSKGKPDPEIFLKAAEALQVPSSRCIGVEDAEAGIEAIQGAGMFAVGVGKPQLLGKADYLVENTSLLSWPEIKKRYHHS
ncbi:beta-phosphoglucomutase [Paenibacillus gansuensis]|uniref:Beta-phosphoglucomutase n=1 Tax=Paenibacillus gansuensis TaxID=306542 RepID=A0ABW5PB48_9BACL